MSARLVCAFAVGGGIPPATYEALRVYDDGAARAVVGNAWPFGAPQDEAGSYEQRLDAAELGELAQAVADAVASQHGAAGAAAAGTGAAAAGGAGAAFADAGRFEVVLGDDRRVAWPTTARPPDGLAPLVEHMRGLLADTRKHPLGAIAVRLEPSGRELGIALHNAGAEPVRLLSGRLQARVTPDDGDGPPDLEALADAAPLDVVLPPALAGGERQTLTASMPIEGPGRWRVDVLARLDAELPYEGGRLPLECVALAGPAVVEVGV